jgi:hypothetical protein
MNKIVSMEYESLAIEKIGWKWKAFGSTDE